MVMLQSLSNLSASLLGYAFLFACAAPLAFQALNIRLTIWSTFFPFFTCANIVGPPSLFRLCQRVSKSNNNIEQVGVDLPHLPGIPLHNPKIRADNIRQVRLVHHQQIALRDSGSPLPWNLVSAAHIDHIDNKVC